MPLVSVLGKLSRFWVIALGIPAWLFGEEPCLAVALRQRDGWCVAETANFRCWMCGDVLKAREVAIACESWRTRLYAVWEVEHPHRPWNPQCDVVVHGSQAAYGTTLGRPGDASVGSSRVQFDGERIVQRRIDLRCDAPGWLVDALPHELAHVVLSERFPGRPVPAWADEGIAMLAESPAKRQLRLTILRQDLHGPSGYSLSELMAVRQMPPPHRRDAFYGQSLAVTAWLIDRAGPQEFARFLEASAEASLEAALRQHFRVAGWDGLEREWRKWVTSTEALSVRGLTNDSVTLEVAATAAD